MDPSGILKWETLRLPPAQLQANHWLCGIGDFLGQEQNYYGGGLHHYHYSFITC